MPAPFTPDLTRKEDEGSNRPLGLTSLANGSPLLMIGLFTALVAIERPPISGDIGRLGLVPRSINS